MGSANNVVSAMAAYLVQGTAATSVSNVVDIKGSAKQASQSFDSILNKVSKSVMQTKTTEVVSNANQTTSDANKTQVTDNTSNTVKTDTTTKVDTNTTQNVTDDNEQLQAVVEEATEAVEAVTVTNVTTETQGTEISPKLQEAISEAGKELISLVADTFDISEEDVVNAMQVLGLMAQDLLNPAVMPQLITQISGQEDTIDLITDTDIYTSLQDLMEGAESMKSELMNEFELSEEGLKAAVQDSKENFANEFEGNLDNIVVKKPLENQVEVPEETVNVVSTNDNTVVKEMDTTKTNAPQSEAFTDKPIVEEKKVEITTEKPKEEGAKNNSFNNGNQSLNLFNQVVNNIADAAANVEGMGAASYTERAQMENIVRQITEKITISAKAEETSMELSLHPASLGNVNILLTSGKDGIVAKFTAQNQIVKEAVETQMVQLQQKFEEQGIKVTSIEVTIASHSFEQNLEQGNDRQSGESNPDKKVKPLRRINLAELEDEEIEEVQSDAERIALQMMAASGNMVDFSA